MSARFPRIASALVVIVVGLVWLRAGLSRTAHRPAFHPERRLAALHRRHERHAVLAARSDQRVELQPARGRVAVQDRQPRPAPRVQARRHAARDQGHPLHDRRHAAIGRRARRQDRRGDLDAQPARGQARGGVAAPALGPRRVVLDRRQGRRPRHLRDDRLPARRAQREDRRDDSVVRQGRRRRSESRRRVRQGAADRSRDRRDRHPLDAGGRQGRGDHRLGDARRRDRPDATTTPRAWCARSTCARASCCGRSTRSRVRASSATTPGKRNRGPSTATPACGRRSPPTRSSGSSTCRSRRRRPISTAAIAPATTCSPRAWSASI